MVSKLLASEGRWIHTLLMLSTATVTLVLIDLVSKYVTYFSDVLLTLVMAWLFAFILSPVVGFLVRVIPKLPRTVAVVTVYGGLFVALSMLVLVVAGSLANSIAGFIKDVPALLDRLPEITAPYQEGLNRLNIPIQLADVGAQVLTWISSQTGNVATVALTGLGVIGNLLIVVFLSLFIVIDKDRMVAFVNRLVPQRYADEARLFETSVASSFGGFLRGQVLQGLVFGAFAVVGSLWLNLQYAPATTALVVVFQIIQFFGPFFSWAPPVIAAAVGTNPDATVLPIFIIMAVGWFITMNIVQPRVMASTVGIHPVMVLASVLIGIKIWGVIGAIFAIPVAAVISSFFFHYLNRSVGGPRDVASRAARRLEKRQGRHIRVPTAPGVEVAAAAGTSGRLGGGAPMGAPPPDGAG